MIVDEKFEDMRKEAIQRKIQQGIQQGIEQGREEAKAEKEATVLRFNDMKLSIEQIAKGTGLTIDEVNKIIEKHTV